MAEGVGEPPNALAGIHPPLIQTPPPIAAKGSLPMHELVGRLLIGTQPPLMQTPPPGNGLEPTHPLGDGVGVGVGVGVGAGAFGAVPYCQPPLRQ